MAIHGEIGPHARLARDALSQWWRLYEDVVAGRDGHPALTPAQARRAKDILAKRLHRCAPGTISTSLFTDDGQKTIRAAIRGWAFSIPGS